MTAEGISEYPFIGIIDVEHREFIAVTCPETEGVGIRKFRSDLAGSGKAEALRVADERLLVLGLDRERNDRVSGVNRLILCEQASLVISVEGVHIAGPSRS